MAPTKRLRDPELVESVQVLESASSSLRRESRKRPRLSHTAPTDYDSSSGHSDVDEESRHRPTLERPPATQSYHDFQRDRDEGSDDSVNDELELARETERAIRRNAQINDSLPAECGVIESITCVNFMCHSKLHVTLGPQINFIIGHNGSGKSAVLTALTICLGGKATSTNRGQSLRAFVKEGQESATLSVRIKNQGISAYMPDVYGDSITVERHFTKSGASGFKLKSINGRVITTKKAALDEICDFYALQLDNPLNVLTQDMARQFLNSSSSHEKYRFFLKGVQLEQLDHDYVLIQEKVDEIESRLADHEDELQVLRQRATKAAAKMKQSARYGTLRDKIRHYSRQQAWSQVEEEEHQLKNKEEGLQQTCEKVVQRQQEASRFDDAYDQANEAHEQFMHVFKEQSDALGPVLDEQKTLNELWDSHTREVADTISDQRQIREQYNNAQRQVDRLTQEIAAERQRLEEADGGSQASRLQEIEEAQAVCERLSLERTQHQETLPLLEKNVLEGEESLQRLQPLMKSKNNELSQAESRLRNLNQDRNQQNAGYNPKLPELLRSIQSNTKFQEEPVGPMGHHVQLLKPEWSSIIERTFGGALNGFVVTSKQDQVVLADLMRKCQCIYPIFIGRSGRLDVSHHEPDQDLDTIMRVLKIDNDLVRNQLIINQAIENTVLVKRRVDAIDFMAEHNRPRNVKACLSMHDTSPGHGIRFYYGRSGLQLAPIAIWKDAPRMKTDVDSQIRNANEIIQGLKEEVHNLEQRKRACNERLTKAKQAVVRHKARSKSLNHENQVAEDNVQRLKDELEQSTPQDGHLDALKGSLQDAEVEKDLFESQNKEADDARDRLGSKTREVRQQRKDITDKIAEIETKIKKARTKLDKQAERRQSALREKNAAHERIQDAQNDRTDEQQLVEQYRQHVANFVEQATQVCPRIAVDPGETYATLEKKLDRMQQELAKFQERIGGDPAQLELESLNADAALKAAEHNIENLTHTVGRLKDSLIERMFRWTKFRAFITGRTRTAFAAFLYERAFRGVMRVNHRRHELNLSVEPDLAHNGGKKGKGRDTKTLSGGEKSFSTICMLLALWDAMGSPIRCLDEFDVFMDSVNRDVSVRMIIGAARRTAGRQFIFITPQAMANIDVGRDIKIIKLSDPERGQTTLNF